MKKERSKLTTKEDWTQQELAAAVREYQSMQRIDAAGQKYNKSSIYRRLASDLGRSEKSVEMRMRNISAVLQDTGLPWLKGLAPAKHVGANVTQAIEDALGTAIVTPLTPLERELRQLRPKEKLSIYEVLKRAGFDTHMWEFNEDGVPIPKPAVTGRAYAWSYEDVPSDQHIFMLWIDDMKIVDGAIRYRRDWHDIISTLERTRPQTAKPEEFPGHFRSNRSCFAP
jgi:hypothetical protein